MLFLTRITAEMMIVMPKQLQLCLCSSVVLGLCCVASSLASQPLEPVATLAGDVEQGDATLAQAEKQLQQSEQQLLQGIRQAERPGVEQAFKAWRVGVQNLLKLKAMELEPAKAEQLVLQMQAKIFQQRGSVLQQIANEQTDKHQDEQQSVKAISVLQDEIKLRVNAQQQIVKLRSVLEDKIKQGLNEQSKKNFSEAEELITINNMSVAVNRLAADSDGMEKQQRMLHAMVLMAQSEVHTLQSLWPQLAIAAQADLSEQQAQPARQIAQDNEKQPSINDYKDEIARSAEQSRKELLAAEQALLQKHPAAETAASLQQCFADFAKFSQALLDIEQTRLEGSLAIYSLMDFKAQLNCKRSALLLALVNQADPHQSPDLQQTNKQMQDLLKRLAKQLPADQLKRLSTAMEQQQRSDLRMLESLYAKMPAGKQLDTQKSRDLAMMASARMQMLKLMVWGEE